MKEKKFEKEIEIAKELAVKAGKEILTYYHQKISVQSKEENGFESPLTSADLAANEIITKGLKENFPYPILTEEEKDDKKRIGQELVWIIDPLDGTKEFLKKNGEFTVNIALVQNGNPVVGVIYLPVSEELFFAHRGKGTFYQKKGEIQRINASQREECSEMVLVMSRSHAIKEQDFIKKINFKETKVAGSSLKGCLIAQAEADVYLRLGNTAEWDICAMDLIVEEAGGCLTNLEGKKYEYNKQDPIVKGFLASNGKIHEKLLQIAKGCNNQNSEFKKN